MPPPPSQAGKFRPKKPKKIIRPGASPSSSEVDTTNGGSDPVIVAAAAAAAGSTASNVVGDPSSGGDPSAAGDRSSSFSGRGSSGGRGGGGRGRGRGPTPQGKVFFTGGDRKEAAPSKGGGGKRSGGSGSKGGTAITPGSASGQRTTPSGGRDDIDASTEEVVGQLETAIGGNADGAGRKESKANSLMSSRSLMDDEYDETAKKTTSGSGLGFASYMYDSDSSDEGIRRKHSKSKALLTPLELPFPTKSFPAEAVSSSDRIAGSHVAEEASVNATTTNDMLEDRESWFLVQLPTRLPPLQKRFADNNHSDGEDPDVQEIEAPMSSTDANNAGAISEVITPPVMTSSFDNILETVAPGRIGKILVYKSGKTVLLIDGDEGNEVRMEVHEGLACSFNQQAVAIDASLGHYVSLGDVKRSMVISPDLSSFIGGS